MVLGGELVVAGLMGWNGVGVIMGRAVVSIEVGKVCGSLGGLLMGKLVIGWKPGSEENCGGGGSVVAVVAGN